MYTNIYILFMVKFEIKMCPSKIEFLGLPLEMNCHMEKKDKELEELI